jgi:hypothetical protein
VWGCVDRDVDVSSWGCLWFGVDEVCNFTRGAKSGMEIYVRGVMDEGEFANAFGDFLC